MENIIDDIILRPYNRKDEGNLYALEVIMFSEEVVVGKYDFKHVTDEEVKALRKLCKKVTKENKKHPEKALDKIQILELMMEKIKK